MFRLQWINRPVFTRTRNIFRQTRLRLVMNNCYSNTGKLFVRSQMKNNPGVGGKRVESFIMNFSSFQATKAAQKTNPKIKNIGIYLFGTCVLAQLALGNEEDLFVHRFVVKADPYRLEEFFRTEAVVEVFSIFPFLTRYLKKRGTWDDECVYRVPIFGGCYLSTHGKIMPKKSKIINESQEIKCDDNDKEEGSKCEDFLKKERIRLVETHNGSTLFDYAMEMGFNLQSNGECEIFFRGTKFSGFFIFRIIFEIQSTIFTWSMENYFKSNFFGESELSEEARHYRLFVPMGVFKEYLYDLMMFVKKFYDAARAKKQSSTEYIRDIDEIKELLAEAGYDNAEVVVRNTEDGKPKIFLVLKENQAETTVLLIEEDMMYRINLVQQEQKLL